MRLRKRDVEALLGSVDGSPGELEQAIAVALARVLEVDAPWVVLVRRAAEVGGWSDARREAVLAADPEALWDLVAELNEVRDLERPV